MSRHLQKRDLRSAAPLLGLPDCLQGSVRARSEPRDQHSPPRQQGQGPNRGTHGGELGSPSTSSWASYEKLLAALTCCSTSPQSQCEQAMLALHGHHCHLPAATSRPAVSRRRLRCHAAGASSYTLPPQLRDLGLRLADAAGEVIRPYFRCSACHLLSLASAGCLTAVFSTQTVQ